VTSSPKSELPILIAGGGIGGLAAALALSNAGFTVRLFEKAPEILEVGAGLQLSPNACAVLDELGILDTLVPLATQPEGIRIRSSTSGKAIAHVPLGSFLRARHGHPYLVVHRADLQKTLLSVVVQCPRITVELGATLSHPDEVSAGHIRCQMHGLHADQVIDGSVLIAADGVWSRLRSSVPGHAQARFSGQTAYRAVMPACGLPAAALSHTGLWLGRNAHVVHYPVKEGKELNIVVLVREDWREENWSSEADRSVIAAALADWAPELTGLTQKPEHWLKWALCAVPASGPWTHGGIALLGDAAHAMLPFAAQGAAMAIEDAAVLARCLADQPGDVAQALKTYEAIRKGRTKKVQDLAARNASIYHMSGPLALARNTTMRLMGPERLAAQMDWIYSWKPPQTGSEPNTA